MMIVSGLDKAAIPAVLLVAVAVCQVTAARTNTLSPWKGGGFGMFASIDSPISRTLAIHGTRVDGRPVRIRVPFGRFRQPVEFSSQFVSEQLVFPSSDQLAALGRAVLHAEVAAPLSPSLGVPSRILRSSYRDAIDFFLAEPVLEVVAAYRKNGAEGELATVAATVFRVKFDASLGSVTVAPLVFGEARVQ